MYRAIETVNSTPWRAAPVGTATFWGCARVPSYHHVLLLAENLRGAHRTSECWKEHWPQHPIRVFMLLLPHTLDGPQMST